MTVFEIFIVTMVMICIGTEIVIACYIAKLFADTEAMCHAYLDLLKDTCGDKNKYFDEWGVALDGWKKALKNWEDTIQIFIDYVNAKDDEQKEET